MVSVPFSGSLTATTGRPTLELTLGSAGPDDWGAVVLSVSVAAGLAPAVDAVELVVAAAAGAPSASVGDACDVAFGYDGSTATVFTGEVRTLRRSVYGRTRITATNGGALLAALRLNQSYEKQTAGDVVRDLAGQAGANTDTLTPGIDLPFYALDDRRNAYEHVAALALLSNCLAFFTPAGGLSFAPHTPGPPAQKFSYGSEVLELEATEAAALVAAATAAGEGAAGSKGPDAWSWLLKDIAPVSATAGSGSPERLLAEGALRSRAGAEAAAKGRLAAAGLIDVTGRALVPGAPAVTVGSTIQIAAAPEPELNGPFLARELQHRFSKRGGFTTLVVFSKAGGAAPGGLPGGLL
jgi:hypothetical protein